jgi:ubiquinone/menaquinone biosynthesis C-methylase UbiE
MRIITSDDIIETFFKIYQRGLLYFFSKFTLVSTKRTKSTFNKIEIESSNWWIIPKIRERWNKIISGDNTESYEHYIVEKYFFSKENLKLLSLGSGVCSHEIQFATYKNFIEIRCVDFSEKILAEAEKKAKEKKLSNMIFECTNINNIQLLDNYYDAVLFHSSLHHFKNIDLLLDKVKKTLAHDGLLIINEYVGSSRLQLKKAQIKEINRILKFEIPRNYKKRFKINITKNKVSGPGLLRMIITDPSEAIESNRIIPYIHDRFNIVEEKKLGGNLAMLVFGIYKANQL